MVLIRFKKTAEGMFISQTSLVRIFQNVIRIAKIKLKDTPEKSLSFSPSTRVGIESTCEYLFLDTDEDYRRVSEQLRANLPEFLGIVYAVGVKQNPNISSLCSAAQYMIRFDEYELYKSKVEAFFAQPEIDIEVSLHGEKVVQNVKDRIVNCSLLEDGIFLLAKLGDQSARVDELVKKLMKELGIKNNNYSITQEELYFLGADDEYECVEDILSLIKSK